ncbi:MAG: hypothetical protein GX085_06375 [Firmicutes bacterium]|nr:hypothetical protein [Bacillota bacterium]
MIEVSREDLVRALKRFKGLAKQDLLASELTPDPTYWRTHAESRRTEYKKLIELVENSGIEKACVYAFQTYQSLDVSDKKQDLGENKGREQAIELFFHIFGIDPEKLRIARKKRKNYEEFSCQYPIKEIV